MYVIAGPNGAGKTTFAAEFLPDFVDCRQFLNADLIAAGLSPFAPETQNVKAGRLLAGADRRTRHRRGGLRVRDDALGPHLRPPLDRAEAGWLPGRPVLPLAPQRRSGRAPGGQPGASRGACGSRSRRAATVRLGVEKPVPTVPATMLDCWWLYDASRLPPALIAWEEAGSLTVVDADLFDQIQRSVGEVDP